MSRGRLLLTILGILLTAIICGIGIWIVWSSPVYPRWAALMTGIAAVIQLFFIGSIVYEEIVFGDVYRK